MPTDQNYRSVSVLYTYNAADSTYNAVPGTTFSLSSTSFTSGGFSYASQLDSISGDDTASFTFANQYRSVFISLRDTSGGSALVDSVIVEVYHTKFATWSSKAIGLYRQYDAQTIGGDVVVPGNGEIKKYWLLDEYPYSVRVRWYYGANKSGRVHYITFSGAN